ncbi:MAG: hypothetical protein OXI87_19630 [Albidovulum sp.]|nr:hypothetical protein [Albidovulum sp.]
MRRKSPAGADATLYDVGRSIALWMSAFEILAPPLRLDNPLGVSLAAQVRLELGKDAEHVEECPAGRA